MSTSKSDSWLWIVLLAIIWPAKLITVYFISCGTDVARELREEWQQRQRYTGWER